MIDRYRKAGGFVQLLNIVETCGPKKQAQFLTLIEQESIPWADAIRRKMLTVEKIFSWDASSVGEIVSRVQELTIGVALHGLSEEQREKAFVTLSHSQKRRIVDIFETKSPSPMEVSTAFMKILEEVRNLAAYGHIKLDKMDPELKIEDAIEEKLDTLTSQIGSMPNIEVKNINLSKDIPTEKEVTETKGSTPDNNEALMRENINLKRDILAVRQDNQRLVKENLTLVEKLNNIKKILEIN